MGSRMEKEREEKEEDSKISRGSSWLEGISSGIRLAGGPRGPPIVGYTRARVSPRATFPGNGRVIPRVTQVPSATEGEIAQRKNFGADLRLSLPLLLPASIHPSISWSDDSYGPSKTGNVILVAVGKKEERRRKERRCITKVVERRERDFSLLSQAWKEDFFIFMEASQWET